MQRPPHFHRGIAHLWPLAVIAGVATAATWFHAATWATRTRTHPVPVLPPKIREASGRLWELARIPGHTLRGLELPGAWWALADLHGATFVDCDMRGIDLRDADLTGVTFKRCHLEGASLDTLLAHNTRFHGCWVRGMKTAAGGMDVWLGHVRSPVSFRLVVTGAAIVSAQPDTRQ